LHALRDLTAVALARAKRQQNSDQPPDDIDEKRRELARHIEAAVAGKTSNRAGY